MHTNKAIAPAARISLATCLLLGTASVATAAPRGKEPRVSPHPEVEAARKADPTANFADPEKGFEAPFKLLADGHDLSARASNPSPFLVDWDEDGDRDLLVGVLSGEGGARIFTNTGDDNSPKYTDSGWIMTASGKPAAAPGIG